MFNFIPLISALILEKINITSSKLQKEVSEQLVCLLENVWNIKFLFLCFFDLQEHLRKTLYNMSLNHVA